MKKQQMELQFLIMTLTLLLFLNINAQDRRAEAPVYNANYGSPVDSWTNKNGWSWTIDDAGRLPDGEGFRWWNNGGNNFSDLFMQLKIIPLNGTSLQIPTANGNAMLSLSANDVRALNSNEDVFPFLF
ncbi:hypothetical protein [Flavobacterium sp.]|uniref:hypothetical protein n=1 Tax=Flavobacterium sp. TaxID=239 RepID=UPI00262FAE5F|nr:hypothetical protein [Flavobacterium sp.]